MSEQPKSSFDLSDPWIAKFLDVLEELGHRQAELEASRAALAIAASGPTGRDQALKQINRTEKVLQEWLNDAIEGLRRHEL